jgi:hypothetical protein
LIVSITAMVAGGDDGLPWRLAGRQWLIESISLAHFDCYMLHGCVKKGL